MAQSTGTEGPLTHQVHVQRAGPADVPRLKGVLARAFDNDPVFNWFVKSDEKRDRR